VDHDGEAPRTRRVRLDQLATQAWPGLEQVQVDGWLLRAAQGVTKRANSALPLAADAVRLDDVLPRLRAFYAARGLPVLLQVSDPAIHAALDERGWTSEAETAILTGPVPRDGAYAQVADAPTEPWLDCWWTVDGRGGPQELAVARRIMARVHAPVGYASVRAAGEVVAVARGVVHDGWLGVFGMAVLPSARRQGHATALLRGLGDWAAQHAAGSTYLQVQVGNEPALRLYDGFGLTPAYRYSYRTLT
jgi:ribosomal protein S18 acetylase RimI-like enzyme